MNRITANLRSYRRAAAERHGQIANATDTNNQTAATVRGTLRRAARAALAAVTPGKGGFESLETRSMMSVSPLGDGAAQADGASVGPNALDVNLQHTSEGESGDDASDTDNQQSKADRKAERAAERAEKKAAKLAEREAKQAAKEQGATDDQADDNSDADTSKADRQAAREAMKAEKAAARAERQAARAERHGNNAPSSTPSTGANEVSGLTLINARSNADFVTLANGATVDLAQVGSRYLSVRAEAGEGVESVSFELDGQKVFTDSGGTFSLRGGRGDNYRGWRATNGSHTLVVTPHTRNGAKGEAGQPMSVTFTVTGATGRRSDFQEPPSLPETDGGATEQPPAPPSQTPVPPVVDETPAPVPVPPPADDVVVVPPGNGSHVIVEPTPSLPQTDEETPAPTKGVNDNINVSIENFVGTITAADIGYFPVKANASGANIARIEFYANGQLIGAANAAPYMIGWQDVPKGSYNVVAKAIDTDGGYKLSGGVTFNVVAAKVGQTITVTPGQSIQSAADRAKPGDTVVVTAGTYKESVKVSTSGTADAPITFLFEKGAVIDASGKTEAFVADGGSYVVVKGLEAKGADNGDQGQNAAVRTGDHWRLEDVTVHHVKATGVGVAGNFVTLVRVTARDNGQNGISSPRGKNVLMIDSKSLGNNTSGYSPQSEGGGGKWARVNNVYITGFETAYNTGPGLWFDINNTNVVLKNSVAHGNKFKDSDKQWQGSGFKTEISQGPMRWENNLTYDNTGAGMSIQESEGVTITGNTLRNDNIELRNYLRNDGDWKLDGLTISGNTFVNGSVSTSSAGTKFSASSSRDMHMKIDGNTYDAGGSFMEWSGKSFSSLQALQDALGFEKNGHVVDGATLKAAA